MENRSLRQCKPIVQVSQRPVEVRSGLLAYDYSLVAELDASVLQHASGASKRLRASRILLKGPQTTAATDRCVQASATQLCKQAVRERIIIARA